MHPVVAAVHRCVDQSEIEGQLPVSDKPVKVGMIETVNKYGIYSCKEK